MTEVTIGMNRLPKIWHECTEACGNKSLHPGPVQCITPNTIVHKRGRSGKWPNHLIWLLLMWMSSSSTTSFSWMTEPLTLSSYSLRESPATLLKKLISAACICNLILLFATHKFSSLPGHTQLNSPRLWMLWGFLCQQVSATSHGHRDSLSGLVDWDGGSPF